MRVPFRRRGGIPAQAIETRIYPQILGIGDSLIGGHPWCFTRLEAGTRPGPNITQLTARRFGWTWADQGIGSNTTSQMVSRFTTDVVNLKPQIVILNGGVNDIAGGGSQATFTSNYTTMLNACQSNGLKAVVLNILPWTNGTTVQMQTRDTWNAALVTLVGTYPGFVSVDASLYVGSVRVGGDANNLWNIAPAFAAGDGVHYTTTGYDLIAGVVARGLQG